MKPFKLVHMADVHLDTAFQSRDEAVGKILREALRQAFQRGMDLALDQNVDCVLIAGDLFDNERLTFETQTFLLRQLRRLASRGIMVFYATGNHDPGMRGHHNHIKWPENVVVFSDGQVKTVEMKDNREEVRARIVSCGHRTNREGTNLAAVFPDAKDNAIHIGMLHTMVTGAASEGSHERYAPCTLGDLLTVGYDYWALGHIHQRQKVDREGIVHYPGNIQGRNPREVGEKGCLLVEILPGSAPQITFIPLSSVQWHWLKLDGLESLHDIEDLSHYIAKSCMGALQRQTDTACNVFRIELSGSTPFYKHLQDEKDIAYLEQQIAHEINALSVEILCDSIKPPVNCDDYRDGIHVLASVLEWIEKARQDPESIMDIIPEKLAGNKKVDKEQLVLYIKELLQDLEQEAVVRMAGDES